MNVIGRIISIFLIGTAIISCSINANTNKQEAIASLEENFKNPPLDARPRGYWTWVDGNYDSTEIWREIRMAKEKGMGGFDIWDAPSVQDPKNFVPVGPDQVSDEFQHGVGIAVNAAREIGFELGYVWNQSVSYPDPEHSHKALFMTVLEPQKSGKQTIELPFPFIAPHKHFGYGTLERDDNDRPLHWGNVAVLAYPVNQTDTSLISTADIIDLTSQVNGDYLEWDVPAGKWKILRFVWSRTTENGLTPTPATLKPALDFLNSEATEIHLTYLLNLMEKHTGRLEGSPLKYLFADSYEFRGLWTPTLPETFEKSIGYSIIKYLPALKGYTVDDKETTKRFLFDYRNLLSELVIQNHYLKAKEICSRYGLGFSSEAAGPGPPVHMDVPMETIKSSGILTFPRGEFWVSEGNHSREHLQIIKGIASAAHQYNQPYVSAESFTGVALWANGPGDLKPYSDRAFAEGLNRIDFHTFPHTPERAGLPGWIYGFANIISENLIWWPKADGFMEYLGRCCYMLQQGHFIGDALYYHGEDAPYFAKPKHIKPELGLGYDYDITNADILINRLTVENNKLVLPHGQQYEILILPDNKHMSFSVLKKVEQLLIDGATVIGPKPSASNGLSGNVHERNIAVKKMADDLWGTVDGETVRERKIGKGKLVWGKTPRQVLLEKGIMPDITFSAADKSDTLDYIHKKAGDTDIYFIRNPYDKNVTVQIKSRITGQQPEIWDPVSGEIMPLSIYYTEENGTLVPLTLGNYESLFLVFQNNGELKSTLKRNDSILFPAENIPDKWPFSDKGNGNIMFTNEGKYTISGNGKTELSAGKPDSLIMNSNIWRIDFTDPWNAKSQAETADLISWTEFDDHHIRYFSGTGTYYNSFNLTDGQLRNKYIFLNISQVEEVAEVFINGSSAGLVWTNPANIEITRLVKSGINELKIEVVNRWPNRMIGDYKLPEEERKVKSNIVTLPSAWYAPLEQLPDQNYPLQVSGIIGNVDIIIYDVFNGNDYSGSKTN